MSAFNPFNPYSWFCLQGYLITRGVTLELPVEQVRSLLPHGLELGPQHVTRPGTHPVLVLFNEVLRAQMSVPAPLISLTYRELSVGVPHCYLTTGLRGDGRIGPFYYQPYLMLESVWATLGGLLFWGMPKHLASVVMGPGHMAFSNMQGRNVVSLSFEERGPAVPAVAPPHFVDVRAMHDQPLVQNVPVAAGPFYACSNFDKLWHSGTVRPLSTSVEFHESLVPDLPTGRFTSDGIDQRVVGSYEFRAPWRLGPPYPPGMVHLLGPHAGQ